MYDIVSQAYQQNTLREELHCRRKETQAAFYFARHTVCMNDVHALLLSPITFLAIYTLDVRSQTIMKMCAELNFPHQMGNSRALYFSKTTTIIAKIPTFGARTTAQRSDLGRAAMKSLVDDIREFYAVLMIDHERDSEYSAI